MARTGTFAVVALLAGSFVVIAGAEPADDDVVWFAELLGGPVEGLPDTMPIREFSFDAGSTRSWERVLTMSEFATLARSSLEDASAADGPAPDIYAGFGVRDATGARGVYWVGQAFGFGDMECIEISEVVVPSEVPPEVPHEVEVPENPVNDGGVVHVAVSATVPEKRTLFRQAVALMDVGVLPAPGRDVIHGGAFTMGSEVLVGGGFDICRMVFNLRFTFAVLSGDGDIHS